MIKAVSDSTVLIYLAKIGELELLNFYNQVVIPEEVYREVVEEGKEIGESDAVKAEKFIEENVEVIYTDITEEIKNYGLEKGEEAVLSLATEEEIGKVLIDESSVRKVARNLDLKPRGTISLLLRETQETGDLDNFLENMEELSDSGFYISEELYMKAVRQARKIIEEN